jgi:hypothetical protein
MTNVDIEFVEFMGNKYNSRHGGPFDRGTADSWYGRPKEPHYFVGATAVTAKVNIKDMTESEVVDYLAGYEWNEDFGGKKEW